LGFSIGDYDCGGGRGNGANYVWITVRIAGIDEFGLDGDGDENELISTKLNSQIILRALDYSPMVE